MACLRRGFHLRQAYGGQAGRRAGALLLPAFEHATGEAVFPVSGGVPGADGIVFGLGAGATTQTESCQEQRQEEDPARVGQKRPHEDAG